MKVRMTYPIAGTLDGVRYPPVGGTFDVDPVVGANLCRKGYAEPVSEPAKPEQRPAKKAETRKG